VEIPADEFAARLRAGTAEIEGSPASRDADAELAAEQTVGMTEDLPVQQRRPVY
jgi:hypothetical protein